MGDLFDFARNGPMYVGIVVALITWFMVTKFQTFEPTTLGVVLAALFAGVVLSFLQKGQTDEFVSEVLGRYAFGLLIGTITYSVIYRLSQGKWPTAVNR